MMETETLTSSSLRRSLRVVQQIRKQLEEEEQRLSEGQSDPQATDLTDSEEEPGHVKEKAPKSKRKTKSPPSLAEAVEVENKKIQKKILETRAKLHPKNIKLQKQLNQFKKQLKEKNSNT